MIISGFCTSGVCPSILQLYLRKINALGWCDSYYQPGSNKYPDKSADQNPVKILTTSQDFSTLPGACQNWLLSPGLILPDLAEILLPVNYDEKSKPSREYMRTHLLWVGVTCISDNLPTLKVLFDIISIHSKSPTLKVTLLRTKKFIYLARLLSNYLFQLMISQLLQQFN